jgi:hypothetical protein
MFQRRRSLTARVIEGLPVVVIVGLAVGAVFVGMTVLATAVPVIPEAASPSASAIPSGSVRPSTSPSPEPTPSVSAAPTSSLPPTRPVIINSAISEKAEDGVWDVYLLYPSFQAGSTPWAAEINAAIKDELDTMATKFELGPAADRQAPGKMNTLYSTFTKDLVTPTLGSFTLTWVDDTVPGYPTSGVISLNYDLATGQQIAFSDVFQDDPTALTLLAQLTPPLVQRELGGDYDQATVADGTRPSALNYANWELTETGLKVTFATALVAPAAKGPVSVVVPWTALKPIMVQTGPVATLAGF